MFPRIRRYLMNTIFFDIPTVIHMMFYSIPFKMIRFFTLSNRRHDSNGNNIAIILIIKWTFNWIDIFHQMRFQVNYFIYFFLCRRLSSFLSRSKYFFFFFSPFCCFPLNCWLAAPFNTALMWKYIEHKLIDNILTELLSIIIIEHYYTVFFCSVFAAAVAIAIHLRWIIKIWIMKYKRHIN